MFRFLYKRGLWAAVFVVGFLGGMLFADSQAHAQALTSPHLADLKIPDTTNFRKYITDAAGKFINMRNSVFKHQDTNRDVMHDLITGQKSYINQAKIAAEACDRAAYDAAIAKINAWADTLDGLIADGEKTIKGVVGPGSIANTVKDVSEPFRVTSPH